VGADDGSLKETALENPLKAAYAKMYARAQALYDSNQHFKALPKPGGAADDDLRPHREDASAKRDHVYLYWDLRRLRALTKTDMRRAEAQSQSLVDLGHMLDAVIFGLAIVIAAEEGELYDWTDDGKRAHVIKELAEHGFKTEPTANGSLQWKYEMHVEILRLIHLIASCSRERVADDVAGDLGRWVAEHRVLKDPACIVWHWMSYPEAK